jgi:hypothetical protein
VILPSTSLSEESGRTLGVFLVQRFKLLYCLIKERKKVKGGQTRSHVASKVDGVNK